MQICPRLNANEIQIPYNKHHKVSSLVKSHQDTHNSTEADKGQSQNICEIRKNVFKIRKNISNRNVFWKSSLKSLSSLKNYYKSQKNY